MILDATCIHCFYLFTHYTFAENTTAPIRGKDFELSGEGAEFFKNCTFQCVIWQNTKKLTFKNCALA